ncbi:hypothetical protein GGP41_005134 [Bipolaris sorokiniana]|uniref:Uncharacterized protein n=1 Tax=Cochliobolus sativus TaxID=45130 RepID=A0A8H5ZI35_COCSA|nr:hypothetical protein GGP41_005134 [Bipolaris sorokiniana]
MQLQLASIVATSVLLFSVATAQVAITCRGSNIVFGGPCVGTTQSCQCNTGGVILSGNCNGQGGCFVVVHRGGAA